MITLNHFLFETFWTIFIMTIVLGGVGIAGIYLAFKKKIIFSKEELFAKKDEYTGIQFLGSGLSLLGVSVWYNFYKGHIFYYSEMWRGFFLKYQYYMLLEDIISIILYSYLTFIFIWIFFRAVFQKKFAKHIENRYFLEFTKIDKFFGSFTLFVWLIILVSKSSYFDTTIDILIQMSIFVSIFLFCSYFFFTKVIFDDKIIEIHGFLKPKQIVLWKDVKNLSYANNKRQTIVIETVDNKKYKISNYLSGLETFISQYKIRNQNNTKKGKK